MRLVLLGPPGAGKGTQAAVLARRLSVPAISTGEIFRANVEQGTELGRTASSYMDEGENVPDEVTNAMVRDRLHAEDAQSGFLLDGYPRNTAQVDELERILLAVDRELDAVVQLTVETDELVARVAERMRTQKRRDDTDEVLRHRLEVYAKQTAPLVNVYADRGLLRPVDGLGTVDEVSARILAALGQD